MTKVLLTPQSERSLKNIRDKKVQIRITNALERLQHNPRSGKKLEGKLKDRYSVRIWPYRILYKFNEKRDIIITDIGHRKEVYR